MNPSSTPLGSAGQGDRPVARKIVVCWSLMPGVLKVPIRTSIERASRPASSASSRRAVASSASPSTSQVPAGASSTMRSTAARYWRTSVTRRLASTGTMATAPG